MGPTRQYTNPTLLINGLPIAVTPTHAKVRRDSSAAYRSFGNAAFASRQRDNLFHFCAAVGGPTTGDVVVPQRWQATTWHDLAGRLDVLGFGSLDRITVAVAIEQATGRPIPSHVSATADTLCGPDRAPRHRPGGHTLSSGFDHPLGEPSAQVGYAVEIGTGSMLGKSCYIGSSSRIGDNVKIGSHADLFGAQLDSDVTISLQNRKPFDGEGRNGFRNALIWHTVLDACRAADEDEALVFISANTNDFWNKKTGKLLDELQQEVTDTGSPPVEAVQTLEEAVQRLVAQLDSELKPDAKPVIPPSRSRIN